MSPSTGSGATTDRIAAAVVLAIVAIAFLVVRIMYSVCLRVAADLARPRDRWTNNKNVPSPIPSLRNALTSGSLTEVMRSR